MAFPQNLLPSIQRPVASYSSSRGTIAQLTLAVWTDEQAPGPPQPHLGWKVNVAVRAAVAVPWLLLH